MPKSIPYGHQAVSLLDAVRVGRSVLSDWLTMGPAVEDFEANLCSVSGAKHAVAVSSGSAALHCAYAAIDLGPGDEIITSALTFASTATTAVNLGARVVFADIQQDTGNIDPLQVEALITTKTKAVVAIDYAGHPADLDELLAITKKHGIALIEDAAHSLGSTYKSRPVGSVADITTFSFFPTKNITTGEGGAVVTDNDDFGRKARLFRSHGMVRDTAHLVNPDVGPWRQEIQTLGLNYRLPDILAALGTSQLKRLSRFKTQRRKVWDRYQERLANISGVGLPVERDYVESMWHLYPIRVEADRRRDIFEGLRSQGIIVQVNYIPVYWHPFFGDLGYKKGLNQKAEEFYRREISLPMFSSLSSGQIWRVSSALAASLGTKKATS
jgi:dTDP-4-amino-4,6-dideoxygalactose transaminase